MTTETKDFRRIIQFLDKVIEDRDHLAATAQLNCATIDHLKCSEDIYFTRILVGLQEIDRVIDITATCKSDQMGGYYDETVTNINFGTKPINIDFLSKEDNTTIALKIIKLGPLVEKRAVARVAERMAKDRNRTYKELVQALDNELGQGLHIDYPNIP